jgi:hypothetical protein
MNIPDWARDNPEILALCQRLADTSSAEELMAVGSGVPLSVPLEDIPILLQYLESQVRAAGIPLTPIHLWDQLDHALNSLVTFSLKLKAKAAIKHAGLN